VWEQIEAMERGALGLWWVAATNPLVSLPWLDRVRAAVARCPLVVLSEAYAGTETAAIAHLVLPAATLGLLLSGIFTNALRLNLRRALGSDYVEAARSRGLSERRVVLHHALPNALLPVLTITGITVASLIGGALLIEVTFSWPGIAFRLQEAIAQRDYPVVQGIVVVVAALVVLVTVVVDLLVALLDPRIRF
jgi:peptide/nickel transport system permease protein